MRKICAWCKKSMGTVPTANNLDGIVSHGICEECVDRIFAQQGIRQSSFPDSIIPAATVGAERKTNWTFRKIAV